MMTPKSGLGLGLGLGLRHGSSTVDEEAWRCGLGDGCALPAERRRC